ncbi:MAG: hypothetical protein MUE67_08895 [Anaerolineales bacterium]|nr:hypothetical protein [Anaerolineales bacterium]
MRQTWTANLLLILIFSLLISACGAGAPGPQALPEETLPAEPSAPTENIGPNTVQESTQPVEETPIFPTEAASPPTTTATWVFPPFGNDTQTVWRVQDGQVNPVDVPEQAFHQYDRSPVSGKLLHASSWPDSGAGPANLSVGDLWIYDLQSQQDQLVFQDETIVEAVWAPNGQDFAYLKATESTYELRWRSADGGDQLLAVDVAPVFSVAPDGAQVAFTRETGYQVGQPGVYVVSVESGEERQIGVADRAGMGSISDLPLWSPDGRYILLPITQINYPVRWVLLAVDGSAELPLRFALGIPNDYQLREFQAYLWMPDSQGFIGGQVQGMVDAPYTEELAIAQLDLATGLIRQVTPIGYGPLTPLNWENPGQRLWALTGNGELTLVDLNQPKTLPQACKFPGQATFVNPFKGYCFSYPQEYQIQAYEYENPLFLGPSYDQSIEPLQARLWIETTPLAEGVELAQAVDELIAGLPAGTPAITRQAAVLGGMPAEILENVPGQLFSRVAVVAQNGMLYQLWFNPMDSSVPIVLPDVERLFQAVSGSFSFLP